MGDNVLNRVMRLRRHDSKYSCNKKFSTTNRTHGFLVEYFDAFTFLISAPEALHVLHVVFLVFGITFPPFLIIGFILEVTALSILGTIMGLKYLKESKELNNHIDAKKQSEEKIQQYNHALKKLEAKIKRLEHLLVTQNISDQKELEKIRYEILQDISIEAALKKLEAERLTLAKSKKSGFFSKFKEFLHRNSVRHYHNFKEEHPKKAGALHYFLNFVVALLTATGIISGIGYLFGVSTTSLGIINILMLPVLVTNPVGLVVLMASLALCIVIFGSRRMFFHSPMSKAKKHIPQARQESEESCGSKRQEVKIAKKYLQQLKYLESNYQPTLYINNDNANNYVQKSQATTLQPIAHIFLQSKPEGVRNKQNTNFKLSIS